MIGPGSDALLFPDSIVIAGPLWPLESVGKMNRQQKVSEFARGDQELDCSYGVGLVDPRNPKQVSPQLGLGGFMSVLLFRHPVQKTAAPETPDLEGSALKFFECGDFSNLGATRGFPHAYLVANVEASLSFHVLKSMHGPAMVSGLGDAAAATSSRGLNFAATSLFLRPPVSDTEVGVTIVKRVVSQVLQGSEWFQIPDIDPVSDDIVNIETGKLIKSGIYRIEFHSANRRSIALGILNTLIPVWEVAGTLKELSSENKKIKCI